jgi:uncharacterized protein YjbJ (UPF0337 family)
MDSDHIRNEARQTAESIKEAAGKAMGDAQSHASALYDQAAEAAQSALGQAKSAAGEGGAAVSRQVEANPMSALVAAGAIGFVLGWLARG